MLHRCRAVASQEAPGFFDWLGKGVDDFLGAEAGGGPGRVLSGLAAGPGAYAPNPAALAAAGGSKGDIRIGDINLSVSVPAGADGQKIGRDAGRAMREELRDLVTDVGGDIER